MKCKSFLVLLSLGICLSGYGAGQSCKINGSTDGSSIMVTSDYLSDNVINAVLDNDSKEECANVSVEVEVVYKCGYSAETRSYTGFGKSCPGSSTTVKIPIQKTFNIKSNVYDFQSYRVISISGSKCN